MTPLTKAYGMHTVNGLLRRHPERVVHLYLADSKRSGEDLDPLVANAKTAGAGISRVSMATLDKLSQGGNHQGVLVELRPLKNLSEKDLDTLVTGTKDPVFLVLDRVQDPHNLGACFRSADAAGVTALIVPKKHSAPVSSVVRKVASGAADSVPIVFVNNLARALARLKELGVWCIGLVGESSKSLYDCQMLNEGPIAVVLGGEGPGLRRLTKAQCDDTVSLPMVGVVESLNVSVTAGVVLYEVLRRRRSHAV